MFTTQQAKEFMLSYQSEVRYLSRMSAKDLRVVHARHMTANGMTSIFGGPVSKDELITAILELNGMGVDKINEATHVLYHSADMPNTACKTCMET